MTDRRGIAPLILVLALAVLVIGGGVYYFQKQKNNEPQNQEVAQPQLATQNTGDTSTWKTYRSEQYKLEFQYPSKWTAAETMSAINLTSPDSTAREITLFVSPVIKGIPTNINCVSIMGEDPSSIVDGFHSIECKSLKNVNGVQYTRSVNAGMSTEQTYREQILNGYFLNSQESVAIQTESIDGAGNKFPLSVSAFDQILSTFKFTKTTPESKIPDSKFCNSDLDCVLFICSGAFNKEWAKTAPSDLPCRTYEEYKASCVNHRCTEVK